MKAPKNIGFVSAEKHADILMENYKKYFSEELVCNTGDGFNRFESLWGADFVIVSHGIEEDPVFNFGNLTALNLFELDFSEFTSMPSRKSAQTPSQDDRNKLLAEVTKYGCINHYKGVRVSSMGKRFFIENAKVWNLYDENSAYYGQAAMFKSWENI